MYIDIIMSVYTQRLKDNNVIIWAMFGSSVVNSFTMQGIIHDEFILAVVSMGKQF